MTPGCHLTIVGLGPGDAALLTIEARETLAAAPEVWLRTSRHPTVGGLPPGPRYESFDDAYEHAATFRDVYESIVERVLVLAARPEGVVYAVPGHPLFGEATVRALLLRAHDAGIAVRIVAGVSFVDTVSVALAIDPLDDGLLIIDALALGDHRRMLVPERPTLVAQVYDRRAASVAKLALLEAYPPEHPVRIVRASGTGDAAVVDTTLATLDHADIFDHLVSVYLPPVGLLDDLHSFEGVRAVIAKLRSPDGGCPWDLEQTHETLKRYLLEEAYEALDALDDGEPARMAEELGDLLMQIVLHAQVAEDAGEFVIEDVFAAIATKLIRRHPHVFGDVEVSGASDVLRNWEKLKSDERGDAPLLDAVPKALPALAQAQSVQSRATKAGLAPPLLTTEATVAALASLAAESASATPESLGELLFAIVGLARAHSLDAEEALRLAVRRFRDEVASREQRATGAG
jgi:tetrapyrrole methylase family protein/MazG family protein